jgi:hypothetical protein
MEDKRTDEGRKIAAREIQSYCEHWAAIFPAPILRSSRTIITIFTCSSDDELIMVFVDECVVEVGAKEADAGHGTLEVVVILLG